MLSYASILDGRGQVVCSCMSSSNVSDWNDDLVELLFYSRESMT